MKINQTYDNLFHHPQFKKLWFSQILSQLTLNLINFSILTHIYSQTKSVIAVSLLWIAYSLPALFFAPFVGSIIDRFSLRKMMGVANFLQAAVVLLYLFVDKSFFLLYGVVFMYSSLDQIYLPAQQASIPYLVDKKLLPVANGLFFLTQQASLLIGFGMGGLFISLVGRQATVLLSGLFLIAAGISVLKLPKLRNSLKTPLSFENFFSDFITGYQYIISHAYSKLPLSLIVVFQIFITVIAVILPTYAFTVLGVNINHSGAILIIPGSIGAIVFTRYLPNILKTYRKKDVIQTGFLVGAISLALMSVLSFTGVFKIYLAILMSLGLGISVASVIIPSQTFLQEQTPINLRGRTYSVLSFMMTLGTTLPMLVVGSIADIFGIDSIIMLLSVLLFVGFIYIKKRQYVVPDGYRF